MSTSAPRIAARATIRRGILAAAGIALLLGSAIGQDVPFPSTQPVSVATTAPSNPLWPNHPTNKPISRPKAPQRVYVIPIRGEINDITMLNLERCFGEAREGGADMVIFRMDTPGGLVSSALDISHFIKSQRNIWTVAYVDPSAYSAGALISLACDEIVMRRNASLGDCAPIVMGGTLEGVEREKIESPLRNEFRDSADLNGYDPLLAQSMVSASMEVNELRNTLTGEHRFADAEMTKKLLAEPGRIQSWKSDWEKVRTVVEADRLLTMNDKEASALGFARAVFLNDSELRAHYNIQGELVELGFSWSEILAGVLASTAVRGILMVVLFLGIYAELNTPGVGLPGLVALVAFLLLICGPWLAGLADWWEVALMILGLVLIAIEVFVIPGFGVVGVLGILFFLAGLIFTFLPPNFDPATWRPFPYNQQTWSDFKAAVLVLLASLLGFAILAAILSRFLRRIPVVNKIFLGNEGSERLATALTPTAPPNPPGGSGLENMVLAEPPGAKSRSGLQLGQLGIVSAPCRPAGKVRFDKRVVDAVADGEFLDTDQNVRIVRFSGASVVVEAVDA